MFDIEEYDFELREELIAQTLRQTGTGRGSFVLRGVRGGY
jgi:hypothetical protein